MNYTSEYSVTQRNEHGYGFHARVSIDSELSHVVGFDIAWQHDGEDIESVGIIMAPDHARALADALIKCADKTVSKDQPF